MRWWPWRRKRTNGADAAAARADAERKLDQAERRGPEIEAMRERLDAIRRANQFAAMIEDALRRPR